MDESIRYAIKTPRDGRDRALRARRPDLRLGRVMYEEDRICSREPEIGDKC